MSVRLPRLRQKARLDAGAVARELLPQPRIPIVMAWHARTDADPGERLLREIFQDALC